MMEKKDVMKQRGKIKTDKTGSLWSNHTLKSTLHKF